MLEEVGTMCGRFSLATPAEQVAEHFGLTEVPALSPRYNIAPSQSVAVVRRPDPGEVPILEFRRWGLIPSWAKDPGIGSRMINARVETAAEKPAFRAAFRRRRCLVPADGFYEWKPHPKRRRPHHVRLATGEPLGLAGLFESWESPEGESVGSCTLLTTAANPVLSALHDRMPIIVDPEHYRTLAGSGAAGARRDPLLDPLEHLGTARLPPGQLPGEQPEKR